MELSKTLSVALFGVAGSGKSSIGNMLISGDILEPFKVSDSASGVNVEGHIKWGSSKSYKVYDMSGVCEISSSNNPHEEVIASIRNCFSRERISFNFICFVMKKGRSKLKDVQNAFSAFNRIFKGGENNFVIIITDSSQKWVDKEKNILEKDLGRHPMIGVDFPFHDDRFEVHMLQKIRKTSLDHLKSQLSNLQYRNPDFQINIPSKFEDNFAEFVAGVRSVPMIGPLYNLASSTAYRISGNPGMAEERLPEGPAKEVEKLVVPVVTLVATAITTAITTAIILE